MPDDTDDELSLYERLKQTSDSSLKKNVDKVDDFDEHDQERQRKEKDDDYKVGKNLKRIRTVASWGVAIFLGVVLLVFLISFVWLFEIYISDVAGDIQKTKDTLSTSIDYVLIILATLFIQNVFGKK